MSNELRSNLTIVIHILSIMLHMRFSNYVQILTVATFCTTLWHLRIIYYIYSISIHLNIQSNPSKNWQRMQRVPLLCYYFILRGHRSVGVEPTVYRLFHGQTEERERTKKGGKGMRKTEGGPAKRERERLRASAHRRRGIIVRNIRRSISGRRRTTAATTPGLRRRLAAVFLICRVCSHRVARWSLGTPGIPSRFPN